MIDPSATLLSHEQKKKLQNEIARANQARAVIENPTYAEAFATLRTALMEQMVGIGVVGDDLPKLVAARNMIRHLDQVKKMLERVMQTGDMAQATIHEDQAVEVKSPGLRERLRRAFGSKEY